ncbi:HET-domain-containing protein [Lojkania enalia]|uniref:HET-domain-containing protein n=1 Tax=Lojkania enalia TaxID=147567 RepID=A0A9P4JW07_9PLEO|nr:HET-domain-containing protein [Didymosphaeria enalia]
MKGAVLSKLSGVATIVSDCRDDISRGNLENPTGSPWGQYEASSRYGVLNWRVKKEIDQIKAPRNTAPRLLKATTLQFEEFIGKRVPPYVILSHAWGPDEILFADIQMGQAGKKGAFGKLKGFCDQAIRDGYEYVWIDTCCIDKTSSAELSESINCMYQWYKSADICYVYLADVSCQTLANNQNVDAKTIRNFQGSRWFTRGWTLQELIAPPIVEFYTLEWLEIGTKSSLKELLSTITGIHISVLAGAAPSSRNIAERMSWAASRQTTKIEDMAYCLLGLFEVNMSLLYGEGEKAFTRLQEEILKKYEDYTIFAWFMRSEQMATGRLLASSVAQFDYRKNIPRDSESIYSDYSELTHDPGFTTEFAGSTSLNEIDPPILTSRGIRISLALLEQQGTYSAYLNCQTRYGGGDMLCIYLLPFGHDRHSFGRVFSGATSGVGGLHVIPAWKRNQFQMRTIYVRDLSQGIPPSMGKNRMVCFSVKVESTRTHDPSVIGAFPIMCFLGSELLIPLNQDSLAGLLIHTNPSNSLLILCGVGEGHPWCDVVSEFRLRHNGRMICQDDFSLGYNIITSEDARIDLGEILTTPSVDTLSKMELRVDRMHKTLPSARGSVFVSVKKSAVTHVINSLGGEFSGYVLHIIFS